MAAPDPRLMDQTLLKLAALRIRERTRSGAASFADLHRSLLRLLWEACTEVGLPPHEPMLLSERIHKRLQGIAPTVPAWACTEAEVTAMVTPCTAAVIEVIERTLSYDQAYTVRKVLSRLCDEERVRREAGVRV